MRITVIGTGYVGLVSGACLAELGHHVTCIDKDEAKITALKNGKMPIIEAGLPEMVRQNSAAGRLDFSADLAPSTAESDIVILAVGTPTQKDGSGADLSYVYAAAEEVAGHLASPYTVVVTKSTVPLGTNHKVAQILAAHAPKDTKWDVASNPEFLREGSAVQDFMHPDRIVVGADTAKARQKLEEMYAPLTRKNMYLMLTDVKSAELIKYAANAFLAVKIGYINEMADLCESLGVSVDNIAKGIGLDKRINPHFLKAGPGFGGSCFPKDTKALLKTAEDANVPLKIVQSSLNANENRKKTMARKVLNACDGEVRGKKIAILGLTFKANTDDMRASPSLGIIAELTRQGAEVCAYDPEGMDNARKLLPDINYAASADEALDGANCAVIITEWDEFKTLDLPDMGKKMQTPVLVDLRNITDPDAARKAGLTYHRVG